MRTNGGCRQAVKTSDCGSDIRGFESHHPPHFQKRPNYRSFFIAIVQLCEFEFIFLSLMSTQ